VSIGFGNENIKAIFLLFCNIKSELILKVLTYYEQWHARGLEGVICENNRRIVLNDGFWNS
jgi:hypothetical protein